MTKGQTAAFVLNQSRRQQGLETLPIGDAGERILLGQALQGVFQRAPLTHVAQAAAQCIGIQNTPDQPIADTQRRNQWLLLQQQHARQVAAARTGLQMWRGQQHGGVVVIE